jgi:hypothetical protein
VAGEAAVHFSVSVWVRDGEIGVSPISSVEEALAFIKEWPVDKRGPLYFVASNSLQSAVSKSIAADEARARFMDFCDEAGVLAEGRIAL